MKVSVIMIMMMMMMVMIYAHNTSLDPDPPMYFETKHSPLTQVSTRSFSMRQVF